MGDAMTRAELLRRDRRMVETFIFAVMWRVGLDCFFLVDVDVEEGDM